MSLFIGLDLGDRHTFVRPDEIRRISFGWGDNPDISECGQIELRDGSVVDSGYSLSEIEFDVAPAHPAPADTWVWVATVTHCCDRWGDRRSRVEIEPFKVRAIKTYRGAAQPVLGRTLRINEFAAWDEGFDRVLPVATVFHGDFKSSGRTLTLARWAFELNEMQEARDREMLKQQAQLNLETYGDPTDV